ncbi:Arc family DNA-binding protein [Luteococcus sp. H138]|uniref:FitA-like ribbon-helix-helix domain-containing protein n=1 Tax=unclassified Luteococcus TaxID=2639923 RepID=UPI00313C58EE
MTAITVRKLPEEAKQRLRLRAAAHGRSMEAEARDILLSALQPSRTDLSWIEQLAEIGDRYDGVELEIPSRELTRGSEQW